MADWYPDPDPARPGLLRWWDGEAWTTRTLWPWAQPGPASAAEFWPWAPRASSRTRLTGWLDGPAGSLLLVTIAAATAFGWATAAVLIAVTVAAGQPAAAAAAALNAAVLVLPVLDLAAAVCSVASRAGRKTPALPGGTARAMREAARRSRAAARSSPQMALRIMRGAVRRIGGRSLFTSLPRPVGPVYAAATSLTFLASAWIAAWSLARGGIRHDALESTLRGQQLAAIFWIVHLIAWCGAACARLNRNRAAARIWRAPDHQASP